MSYEYCGKQQPTGSQIVRICIRHLLISHNAPDLPPKILHNLGFSFLLGINAVPREIENNAYANFLGANKVHYGKCARGVSKFIVRSMKPLTCA